MDNELNTLLSKCTGFDWDEGNFEKNWIKHSVGTLECEQIFFNQPLIIQNDTKHSDQEARFFTLGKTDFGRMLFISFTVRNNNIRVISARDMSRKERKIYEETNS